MSNAATRGWGDPTRIDFSTKVVPIEVDNTTYRVNKDVSLIFKTFLTRLCEENNYSLDEVQDDWSWIVRPIRGHEATWEHSHNFDDLSNHSWGLAVDVNATKNPMGPKLITDLPVAWIRANAKKYGIIWGGDYNGRKDSQHFEFGGTPKDARSITDRIKAENVMAKLDQDDLVAIDSIVKKYVHDLFGETPDKDKTHVSLSDLNGKLDQLLSRKS